MKIRNVEFAFSPLNANDFDRFERLSGVYGRKLDEDAHLAPQVKCSVSGMIRSQCRIYREFFDELLGKGSAEALGLSASEPDLAVCVSVFNEFAAAVEQQIESCGKLLGANSAVKTVTFPQANRAARRKRRKNHG